MVNLYGSIRSVIDPEKQRVELKDTWPTAALHIIWRRGRGGGISLHCPHTRSLAPRTITFPQYSFTQPHKATLLHPTHTDVRSELVANTVCWGYQGVRCLLEY